MPESRRVLPFYERHQFVGQFVSDGLTTSPVRVVVEFSRLSSGRIKGTILDEPSAFEVAYKIYKTSEHVRLVSTADTDHVLEIDNVWITRLTFGGSPPTKRPPAEFTGSTFSEKRQIKTSNGRGISFRLSGGLGTLKPLETEYNNWTGDRSIERAGPKLDLGIPWNGKVELRNEYLWESAERPADGQYARVATLRFECHAPRTELPDEALLFEAKAIADDVTLLMSFARRQWVVWYHYTFWTPNSVRQEYKHSSRDTSNENNRIWDSPVGLKASEFLTRCLPTFRQKRDSRQDLTLPIAYSIPNAGARYIEERFAAVFWALEKLIELTIKNCGRDKLLKRSAFRQLGRKIKDICKKDMSEGPWGDAAATQRMLESKIPELNRPSIGSQLIWLCGGLNVTWRDLYPADYKSDLPQFIKTRNDIFHSSEPIDGGTVLRETDRVSVLFERLVLKTLGWTDLTATDKHAAKLGINKKL